MLTLIVHILSLHIIDDMDNEAYAEQLVAEVERRNPGQSAFHQAVREAIGDLAAVVAEHGEYRDAGILERLLEPERVLRFRVTWTDDAGKVRVNRGYRVQFSSALGPYKGGLRFDPSVEPGLLKFLGFEQTLKNGLTGLPMGGAKGGADFSPRDHSAGEVMRFCQAFMTELRHHIGFDLDVPAGDIGVGAREIGYLVGQYRRLQPAEPSALTGKPLVLGGSPVRSEATGWGCVYFAEHALEHAGRSLDGATCTVSGAGNVALHTAGKLVSRGARVVTLSDSGGTVHAPDGLDEEALSLATRIKRAQRGRLADFAEETGLAYHEGERPWSVPCDVAFPCATQNELGEKDARALADAGCALVCEGANMPCTSDATRVLKDAGVLHAPGKAANAGGVAISGLEMSQNAMRTTWSSEEVDDRLQTIMRSIFETCVEHGEGKEGVDYRRGANVGGFRRVADAMLRAGVA
jgi:glutamate dehydrogenase (NADP+)